MKRKYFDYDDPVIPTHFPRLMVEVASDQGADRAGLLSGTAISTAMFDSPEARISLRQYSRLCRNALRITGNSGLGIDLGRRVHLSNLGMLGLAAMSSADAKAAVELCLRYYRLLAPFWDVSLQADRDLARIVLGESVPLREQQVFATEIFLVSSISIGRALLGPEFSIHSVDLSYPKPHHAQRYAEITDAPVRFSRPVTQIVMDAALLQKKLPSSDPATVRAAERQCAASLSSAAEGLVGNVRRLLEASPGRYLGPQELAQALQTSERTLRRELVEMGTSYQSLLDMARCKHATELLVGTNMSINEIAEMLGFSEGSALRRAFKRWTGRTVVEYRREQRSHSPA